MERMTTAEREAAEYQKRVRESPSAPPQPSDYWLLLLAIVTFLVGGGVIGILYGPYIGAGRGAGVLCIFLAVLIPVGYAVYRSKIESAGKPGRFAVTGVDRDSGKETAVVIEASSNIIARAMGEQRGMIVAKVKRV